MGFLKGRHIAENSIKLLNLMDFCDKTEMSCVVLSIDFEKAFDKLEYESMDCALKALGVGDAFIRYTLIL